MKIFFSWQSDITQNREIIEPALRNAVVEFNSTITHDSILEIDYATRNSPGSPDIAVTILEKIRNADFFICDVTSIIDEKDIANSNVMFELGFAVCCLGWERIILLYNTNNRNIETQLPFDIRNHNVQKFTTKGETNGSINSLKSGIFAKLKTIYEKNPTKLMLFVKEKEIIQKKRDIKNLKWVISNVFYLNIWDEFFNEFPTANFSSAIVDYLINLDQMYKSTYWFFYDQKLQEYFYNLASNIGGLFGKSQKLMIYNSHNRIVPNKSWTTIDEDTFKECIMLMNNAQQAYLSLIEYVRTEYPEIDIDSLSEESYRSNTQRKEKINKMFYFNQE